jgi:hypothetical protein
VFIVQDVWHSQDRIIRKLPRDHSNYNSICREIRQAFSVCLPKRCGLLLGPTVEQLRQSLSDATDVFKDSLRSLVSKYTTHVDTDSYSAVENIMSQIVPGEDVAVSSDVSAGVHSSAQQVTGGASKTRWDRARRVLDVGWEGCDNNQVSLYMINILSLSFSWSSLHCPHKSA